MQHLDGGRDRTNFLQGGAVAARRAHNPEVAGSIPAPASNFSNMSSSTSSSGGIGFAGLLTIVFITLKLIGTISWSWWWVLAPIWITALLVGAVVALALAVALKR